MKYEDLIAFARQLGRIQGALTAVPDVRVREEISDAAMEIDRQIDAMWDREGEGT